MMLAKLLPRSGMDDNETSDSDCDRGLGPQRDGTGSCGKVCKVTRWSLEKCKQQGSVSMFGNRAEETFSNLTLWLSKAGCAGKREIPEWRNFD